MLVTVNTQQIYFGVHETVASVSNDIRQKHCEKRIDAFFFPEKKKRGEKN